MSCKAYTPSTANALQAHRFVNFCSTCYVEDAWPHNSHVRLEKEWFAAAQPHATDELGDACDCLG